MSVNQDQAISPGCEASIRDDHTQATIVNAREASQTGNESHIDPIELARLETIMAEGDGNIFASNDMLVPSNLLTDAGPTIVSSLSASTLRL